MIDSMHEIIREALANLSERKEISILDQLGDLITKGYLVIEETDPMIVQDPQSNKLEIRQAVRLKLRDKEIHEALEAENANLRAALEEFVSIKGMLNLRKAKESKDDR